MGLQHEDGDARVRKALDDAFARQNAYASGKGATEESFSFCRNPMEYEWKYIGKRNMLIPYTDGKDQPNAIRKSDAYGSENSIHLEMQTVWVVEGSLRRGESNVLALRRFYIHDESWLIVLGEGYDSTGTIASYYMLDKQMPADGSPHGRWVQNFLTR